MSQQRLSTALSLALALLAPCALHAQDDKPERIEEDLGDGFRSVRYGDGPPAIIDDETGLIMKQVYGQPAVVDKHTGAILTLDDEGNPQVTFWKGKGGDAQGQLDKKTLARMKDYMARVSKLRAAPGFGDPPKGKPGEAKTTKAKAKPDRVALYLELLGLPAEEAAAIRPLITAIVQQQDAIRRSTVELTPLGAMQRAVKTSDLPSAIQTLRRTLQALRKGETVQGLEDQLAAFREARKAQDAELAKRRAALRELLTIEQETKLTASGLLD